MHAPHTDSLRFRPFPHIGPKDFSLWLLMHVYGFCPKPHMIQYDANTHDECPGVFALLTCTRSQVHATFVPEKKYTQSVKLVKGNFHCLLQ